MSLRLTLILLAILLHGCSNNQQIKTLAHADQMATTYWSDGAQIYLAPGLDSVELDRYKTVILEPVSYIDNLPGKAADITPQERQYLRRQLDQSLRQALGNSMIQVQQPAKDTLAVRVTITSLRRHSPERGVTDYLPFRLVIDSASAVINTLQDEEEIVYSVAIEMEGYDATTGKLLFAMADQRTTEPVTVTTGSSATAPLDPVVQYWSERFQQNWRRKQGTTL